LDLDDGQLARLVEALFEARPALSQHWSLAGEQEPELDAPTPGAVQRTASPACPQPETQPELDANVSYCSPDGTLLVWPPFGRLSWAPLTGKAIRRLYDAHHAGSPEVRERDLLREIGSKCTRLKELLRKNPHWRQVIVRGRPGRVRLAPLPGGPEKSGDAMPPTSERNG
jgi:hypothetical protein